MKLVSAAKALAVTTAITAGAYTYENRSDFRYCLESLLADKPRQVVQVKDKPDILLASYFSPAFPPKFHVDPRIDLKKICCEPVDVPRVSKDIVRKYDWAFERAIGDKIVRERMCEIFTIADDPYLILAVMMQESGLKRKPNALRGCHGSLQIKKDVFDHVQKHYHIFRESGTDYQRKLAKNLEAITWDSVMNNNLEAQIIVFEAYLGIIKDILRPKCGRISEHELQKLALESFNLGYNVLTSAIDANAKSKHRKPVSWDSLKYDICSLQNLRKHLGWLGNDAVLSRRRGIAMAYADSCAYNYCRLKGDKRLLNLVGQYSMRISH